MEFVCQVCASSYTEAGYCAHDGSPLQPSSEDPLIGSNVGPYRIESLIGVGGMGRVYKAEHPKIGSRVAVKVLADHCATDAALTARFFDEARAVNMIRHENIVNILDLAYLDDGRPYIVMEFLDGRPLADAISAGPLPIGTTLRIIEDVLSALDAAHEKHIVHRDLKPDNIIISPKGRAYVLDFGVAKLSGDQKSMQGQTQAGSLLGTPSYMSPEQALSRPIDTRADLYSMGIILFECLTGKRPFQADSLFVLLEQHVHQPPPRPRSLRPGISPGLEEIILRSLEKAPEARWLNAREFSAALVNEQHGLPDQEWAPIGSSGVSSSASNSPSHPQSGDAGGFAVLGPGPSAPFAGAASAKAKSRVLPWSMLALVLVATAGLAIWAQGDEVAQKVAQAEPLASDAAAVAKAAIETDAALPAQSEANPAAPASDPGKEASRSSKPGAPAQDGASKRQRQAPKKEREAPVAREQPRVPAETDDTAKADKPSVPNVSLPRDSVPRRTSHQTKSAGRFDASAYLSKATATARQAFSDAKLVRIDADGVRPNGKADLGLSDKFSVTYRFISPSKAKRPKDLPMGVEHKPTCLFYVVVGAKETDNYPLKGWDCKGYKPLARPRCSMAQVWKRAIADGAPKANAVAELGYRKSSGSTKWYFSIGDVFSKVYPDDC